MPWEPSHVLRSKLRKLKPDYVMALLDDGEEQQRINCPPSKKMPSKVLEVLSEVSWISVELFDKKGGLLGKHVRTTEDETAAGDLETLLPSKHNFDVQAMVNIVVRAQDAAVDRVQRIMQPLLDATYKLIDKASTRLDLVEKQYEHQMHVNAKQAEELARQHQRFALAIARRASDENDEPSSSDVLADLMPDFIRAALEKNDAKAAAKEAAKGAAKRAADAASTKNRPKERPGSPKNGASAPHT